MASINTSSKDPIYLAFRSAGPSADLIVPATVLNFVALVGIVLNGTVLVVTVKSNSLRGSANFLMAFICLCELVHQIGHSFFFFVVVSGINFVNLLTADLFMTPMIFALNCGTMAMLCAACDRLCAVISPFQYNAIVAQFKFGYLLAYLFICTFYGLFTVKYVLESAIENAEDQTTGLVAETLQGHVINLYIGGTFFLCFCCICCYVVIFLIVQYKNGVTQQTNTRLLRSLVIILSINVGGYLFSLAMYQFIIAFGQIFGDPIRVWQFGFIAGILLNAAAGSNAVVLYFNSTEYRQVFRHEFRAVLKCFTKNNVPQTIQMRSVYPVNSNRSTQMINGPPKFNMQMDR